ncbi:EAL domain-containing protein [Pantoea stewartii]|uniref:EAL domain-containing protein n=1 Tax=Pantoea stewartii TaxID=66269 RepID=UPI003241DA8D
MLKTEYALKINLSLNVSFILEPIRSPGGGLLAMEILSRFRVNDEESHGTFSPDSILRKVTLDDKKKLFAHQLDAVERQSAFFSGNNVLCSLNVDVSLAEFICNSPDIKTQLINMPFVRLEISEMFPEMNNSLCNPLLVNLSRDFGLWLDDFGSGYANMSAIHSGLFETVKINKAFFWKHVASPLWPGILREIRRDVTSIIVEGVETEAQTDQLRDSVEGLQGYLFPPVPLSEPEAALALPDKVRHATGMPGSIVSLRQRSVRHLT